MEAAWRLSQSNFNRRGTRYRRRRFSSINILIYKIIFLVIYKIIFLIYKIIF